MQVQKLLSLYQKGNLSVEGTLKKPPYTTNCTANTAPNSSVNDLGDQEHQYYSKQKETTQARNKCAHGNTCACCCAPCCPSNTVPQLVQKLLSDASTALQRGQPVVMYYSLVWQEEASTLWLSHHFIERLL